MNHYRCISPFRLAGTRDYAKEGALYPLSDEDHARLARAGCVAREPSDPPAETEDAAPVATAPAETREGAPAKPAAAFPGQPAQSAGGGAAGAVAARQPVAPAPRRRRRQRTKPSG